MMKKNLISLHASYFGNNYGDILLVKLFYNWIQEISDDLEINLPLAYKKGVKDLPTKRRGIVNLLRSKCLVYCGGGYFGEQPREKFKWSIRNFFRHIIVGIIAVVGRIPIAIIGVEFGPLSFVWSRKLVVWLAKHAKVVVVRNAESKEFLERYGVNNVIESVDAVLTLKPSGIKSNKNEFLIHIPNIRFAPEKYILMTNVLIKALSDKAINAVTFIEDTYGQYSNGYESVFELFAESNISYSVSHYQGPDALIEKIARAEYLVTTKLHVGITGAAMNKNVLAIYNHPKTIRFHKQIGNEANCLPMSADEEEMRKAICHFLNDHFILSDEIRKKALTNKNCTIEFVRHAINVL